MLRILDLSRATCFYFTGYNESWCSKAHRSKHKSRFWRVFAKVMGERHCEKSYAYHNPTDDASV
jgi:hypothetical protein